MGTTTETLEEHQEPAGEPEPEDRSTRRLLIFLLVLLGVAAIALLGLLLWLLRPKAPPPQPGQAAGYPIRVQTTIYGYDQTAGSLVRWPLGVAFDGDGNVWISNTGQSRVDEYTSSGGYIRTIGDQEGEGKLLSPYGIAIDPARDRVYVADPANRNVQVYTASSGAYIMHFPADDQDAEVFGDQGFTPFDVEVAGGRVVVSSNDGLYFFDDSGHVVARWGGTNKKGNVRGSDLGSFNFPDSFTYDPNTRRFYVADTLNRRVVALGSQGRWLWLTGQRDVKGKIVSFWMLPRGVQVGPDGNIYIVDTFRADGKGMGTGHILVLSPEGELLTEFGRSGSSDGSFEYPEQLAAGPDGLWAIADRENNRVVIFELVTPYPPVDDIYEGRYPKTFMDLTDRMVTSTPMPTPSPTP
jgi:DNA-binding beta-propeller fold protein YncE